MIKQLCRKAKKALDEVGDRAIHVAIITILFFALTLSLFMLWREAFTAVP